jgi:type I restriction enzyme R subunit
VDAYHHFADPEWDGEPEADVVCKKCGQKPCVCENHPKECPNCGQNPCICEKPPKVCPVCGQDPCVCENQPKKKVKIKLRDGKEREIQHMISTSFWGADGKPVSIQEFMDNMFGAMPEFFKNEEELRKIWSNPTTRKVFLDKIAEKGYGIDELEILQKMIDAEQSDLFDVLNYISFLNPPISRAQRVEQKKIEVFDDLDEKHKEFLAFVLSKYEEKGVEELDEEKLPILLNMKYHAISDAINELGDVDGIRSVFFNFQKALYSK